MRILTAAALATGLVISAGFGVAAAAPKNYCTDLKGVDNGQTCQIQIDDPAYNVTISFPSSYPDAKSIADYVSQARDGFVNAAKSAPPHDLPLALDITPTTYGSAIPPRGTEAGPEVLPGCPFRTPGRPRPCRGTGAAPASSGRRRPRPAGRSRGRAPGA